MAQVRLAEINDIPSLVRLVERYWSFEGIPNFKPETVENQLSRIVTTDHLGFLLIASHASKLVGYLLGVYVFSLEHLGLTAEIDGFFVDSGFRSEGRGTALLKRAESVALSAGCTNLSLELGRDNEGARSFHRRHGFVERSEYELLEKDLYDTC